MKKIQISIAVLAMVVLCSFVIQPPVWEVPQEFKTMKNPVAKTDKALANGKVNYEKICAGCHGLSGKGDGARVKNLSNITPASLLLNDFKNETDGEHFYKIKYGRKQNHSFYGKLDDESIWEIVHYIKTFSGK